MSDILEQIDRLKREVEELQSTPEARLERAVKALEAATEVLKQATASIRPIGPGTKPWSWLPNGTIWHGVSTTSGTRP